MVSELCEFVSANVKRMITANQDYMNTLLCNLLTQDMSASLVCLMVDCRQGSKSMQMLMFFVYVSLVKKIDCGYML